MLCVSSGQAHGQACSEHLQGPKSGGIGAPSGTSPAAQFYPARAPVCMHVGMSVLVSKRDLHPAPIAVPWSPLKPKDPKTRGHVHPQKDGPAPKLVSGPLGKELWSPSSQSMAWKGEHGHNPCALGTAHPWGVAQPEKRELGPGLRTTLLLGKGCFHSPPVAGCWPEP